MTLPILRDHLVGYLHVSEGKIVLAMRFAYEQLKLVVEPSSVVSHCTHLVLRDEASLFGKRVGCGLARRKRRPEQIVECTGKAMISSVRGADYGRSNTINWRRLSWAR